MVYINYNQKETKSRPGCFNYFSHIIWFVGTRKALPKKKDKKELKLHGKKSAVFVHTVHLFSTTVDKADDLPQNLTSNCPWIQNEAMLDLSCSEWT